MLRFGFACGELEDAKSGVPVVPLGAYLVLLTDMFPDTVSSAAPCFAHVRSCVGFWWVTKRSPSRGFSVGELCTDLDMLSCHRFPETPLSQ